MNLQETKRKVSNKELNESGFFRNTKDLLGRIFLGGGYNFKPSLTFDENFGTQISQKYDFPFDLSENKIWRLINSCYKENEKSCNHVMQILENLGDFFPYADYNNLPFDKKLNILQGMVSNFNYDDIVSFAIEGKTGIDPEVDYQINELQKKLNYNIQWIPSTQTIEKIKTQLNLQESILRIKNMMGINESTKSYISSEMDEIERAVQDLSRDEDIDVSVKEVKKKFQDAEPEKLSKSIWKKLENTESNEIDKGDMESVEKIAKKYNKTSPTKLKKSLESGDYKPPMIIKFKNRYHLVAGNTRLCTAAAMGITPNVLIIEI